jgi:hypothetical protein
MHSIYICFDTNGKLALTRHDQMKIISKETMTQTELDRINNSIYNIMAKLVYLDYSGNDDSEVKDYIKCEFNAVKYTM